MKTILAKYFRGDLVIWMVIIILSIFSLLAVYSSTGTLAYKSAGGNTTFYLFRHSVLLVVGFMVIYFTHLVPYIYFSRIAQILFWISIPLIFLTTFILGTNMNEASRWLTLPGIGLTFQTSDLAKLALIMYIARLLSQKQDSIKSFKDAFKPLMIPVILTCGMILPANFSTAAILFTTSMVLMFIGRVNIKYILYLVGIGIVLLSIFITIIINTSNHGRVGTWKKRIENFTSNDIDSDSNFQADQAKIAIVTGGILGKGPGNSTQRNYLPHPYSDFIFAIIIEEYGSILGGGFVVILYLILLYRAIIIVKNGTSQFGAFMAIGLTFSLVFQGLINMAVAVNLFPVTGQTLPFVSMGGTSILFTSVALGIVLSVSRSIQNTEENANAEN